MHLGSEKKGLFCQMISFRCHDFMGFHVMKLSCRCFVFRCVRWMHCRWWCMFNMLHEDPVLVLTQTNTPLMTLKLFIFERTSSSSWKEHESLRGHYHDLAWHKVVSREPRSSLEPRRPHLMRVRNQDCLELRRERVRIAPRRGVKSNYLKV